MEIIDNTEHWCRSVCRLVERPSEGRAVFVVGAGLSRKSRGVWGAQRFLAQARRMLRREALLSKEHLPREYQDAMRLLSREEPDLTDRLVRHGVLAARDSRDKHAITKLDADAQHSACRALQTDFRGWFLPPAIRALASLCRCVAYQYRKARGRGVCLPCIVTTNFDGLIELALLEAGVPYVSRNLVLDQYPDDCGDSVPVWHVHGWWLGNATLHSQTELEQKREKLEHELRRVFRGARVFVMGYGAWPDAVFRSLTEAVSSGESSLPSVAWSFFEAEHERIRTNQRHVLSALQPAGSRVRYFSGIDAHKALPRAARRAHNYLDALVDPKDEWLPPQLLARLLEAAPQPYGARLRQLLGGGTGLGYFGQVVQIFCEVVRDVGAGNATEFALAANEALGILGKHVLTSPRIAADVRAGRPVPVRFRTTELTEILVSGALGRTPRWGPEAGRDRLFDGHNQQLGRSAGQNWVAAFEALTWSAMRKQGRYCPNNNRDELAGELHAKEMLGERCYAIVAEGADDVDWEEIAHEMRDVTVLICADAPTYEAEMTERTLAELIRTFLRLAPTLVAEAGVQ